MLPFFAWKIFSISFFISLDFYLQVLFLFLFYLCFHSVLKKAVSAYLYRAFLYLSRYVQTDIIFRIPLGISV